MNQENPIEKATDIEEMPNSESSNPEISAAESDWRSILPEDMRHNESLAKFKNVADLAKSYIHSQFMLGRLSSKTFPREEDPPEVWEKYYSLMGKPPQPDNYEFARPEMPEGIPYDEEMEKEFRNIAFNAGLNKQQAKKLYDWYVEKSLSQLSKINAAIHEKREKAEEMLRREWGAKFDENLALARQALRQFADKEYLEALDEGAGNDVRLIKVWVNVAKQLGEDRLVGGQPSPKTAYEKALELVRHPAYIDDKHPDHKRIVAEATAAFQKAFPT